VLGVLLYVALWQAGLSLAAMLAVLVAAVAFAIWLASLAERELADHDSGIIVLDEIVGMAIALVGFAPSLTNVVVIFLAFRAFDVVKVWPASWIDRDVPGGTGVVLDDVVSGVYANVLARFIL